MVTETNLAPSAALLAGAGATVEVATTDSPVVVAGLASTGLAMSEPSEVLGALGGAVSLMAALDSRAAVMAAASVAAAVLLTTTAAAAACRAAIRSAANRGMSATGVLYG